MANEPALAFYRKSGFQCTVERMVLRLDRGARGGKEAAAAAVGGDEMRNP